MQDMIQIFKEHKIVLVALALLIVMFIGWSIWQYSNNQATQAEQSAIDGNESLLEGDEKNDTNDAGESETELTERQREIIAGYDNDKLEFVARLSANIWTDSAEQTTLTFTKNTYTEVKGETRETNTYVVTSLVEDKITGEGSTYEGYVASLETDSGTYILKMQRWVTAEGKKGAWKLSSDGFALAKEYSLSKAANNFTLEKFDKEASLLLGGKDALEETIGTYVAATYPSATTGTWNGKVEIDWQNQVSKTWFNLDTKSSTQLVVIYRMDTGEIEVR